MKKIRTLRLILGDQLNEKHSWFHKPLKSVTYVMMEMRQETDYVLHHIQKVTAFFMAMRNFASMLEKKGHDVIYLTLDNSENRQDLKENILYLVKKNRATSFEYLLPDEMRLDKELKALMDLLSISVKVVDTEHFLSDRYDVKNLLSGWRCPIRA